MQTDDLLLLIEVADLGSFSRVAAARGLSVSTVARRIEALEAMLGLALLDRRADGVRLTPEGRRVAAAGTPLVEGADALARLAGALRTGGRLPVVVSATEPVVAEILAPALPRLWSAAPGLRIDLRARASVVSLARREADLLVRMSPPDGASLVARKLADLGLGLYASASYLGDRAPGDLTLSAERLAVYDDSYGAIPELDWLREPSLEAAVVFRTSSTRALLTAAIASHCISLLPRIMAENAGLTRVPTAFDLPTRQAWLVMHPELRRRPDIAIVKRWIVEAFGRRTRAFRDGTDPARAGP
ncbi:MAG: LysR family transcriptional regulator [Methylobacteriaceae bacterium]|nr:LysR family transcriptional regulator [Methylobacteriaceae bacterium]